MKKEQALKKIEKIMKIEEKAKKLQAKLDELTLEWEKIMEEQGLRNTSEFLAYCEANGIVSDYSFNDILC